jgi:hypothetical protein
MWGRGAFGWYFMNSGFDEFWAVWPKSPRKGAKLQCLREWEKKGLWIEQETIIAHVKWLSRDGYWINGNVCAPLVYLHQRRWDGAEIPPSPEKVQQDLEAIYQAQLAASIAAMRR